MLTWDYEQRLWQAGFKLVAGVDEVGRGAWAGPIVAAAVILSPDIELFLVKDSKLLTSKQREKVYEQLITSALGYCISKIDSEDIDKYGLTWANQEVLRQAVLGLAKAPDYAVFDGLWSPALTTNSTSVVNGDATILSVAAASILAKVARDRLMRNYGQVYPGYGFSQHVGYGTHAHQLALARQGVCPIHRRSFRPVANFILNLNVL